MASNNNHSYISQQYWMYRYFSHIPTVLYFRNRGLLLLRSEFLCLEWISEVVWGFICSFFVWPYIVNNLNSYTNCMKLSNNGVISSNSQAIVHDSDAHNIYSHDDKWLWFMLSFHILFKVDEHRCNVLLFYPFVTMR